MLQTKKMSLRASEQLFRSIFENAQFGMGIFKIESQEHISNYALQEMLGHTQEQLSHLAQWDEIVPARERVACAERYMELVQGKREKGEYEQHFIRRDGIIFLGNGRFQLRSCAERLERAFRGEFPDSSKTLEEFTAVLNSQVDSIQQALHDSVLDLPEKEEQKASNFDRRKASAAILHLKALLESRDGDAAEAFVSLDEDLVGTCDKSRLSALRAAMSEFNYDVSLFKLDEIATQCGANWKHSK